MCIALAKKHSFEGMEMAFQAWNREIHIDNVYTSHKTSLVWEMIIDSQAYTCQKLHPGIQKFIENNLESFETILPMLGLRCKTPSPKLLLSMKQSGFEKIAQETGSRVLNRHRDLFDDKFLDLEAVGVTISTAFIISTLNQEQGDAWKMAMSYYLDKDDLKLNLNDIDMPYLMRAGSSKPELRTLRESNLLDLLKRPGLSETARAKRHELLSLYTDKDSQLMKRLLAKDLPESYLVIESVREEKLYMDLGL